MNRLRAGYPKTRCSIFMFTVMIIILIIISFIRTDNFWRFSKIAKSDCVGCLCPSAWKKSAPTLPDGF